ncbi:MAG: aminotransferase class I/II-fold pyridoxal phosphate-dependent enzyme, partial [Atopobiaceae bacterium]|nr:aminotransferase class I/II-fold pyridoxal phosphate-dependent enzyme [Atopobiaceae bacterium]
MPNIYERMTDEQLKAELASLTQEIERLRAMDLSLDMARGKPTPRQTDLSRPMLDALDSASELIDQGTPADNYGQPDGIPSARDLFAEMLGVDPANVAVVDSASLAIMYSCVVHGMLRGVRGHAPWKDQGSVKFLCPSPGYDRHFGITAYLGIENVPVAMTPDGPDMDEVERLVEGDASVKGIWCVPKYQNPTGISFSDEVVRRFAALKPAAPDFRIYWDNAYVVHDFNDTPDEVLNIFEAMEEAGTSDLVYEFASTSKVTFPGSGMACITASPEDMAELRRTFLIERVSPNKMDQLMHVRFLPDLAAVKAHMRDQADKFVRPRFELVQTKLEEGLGGLGIATWT